MTEPIEIVDWPEDWPPHEGLKFVEEKWPAGGLVVFYRPSPIAPEHVTDFVVCEVTGRFVDDDAIAGLQALFVGFRKWDGCTQLKAPNGHYFLHYDEAENMDHVLKALQKLIWSEALDPEAVDVGLTRGTA